MTETNSETLARARAARKRVGLEKRGKDGFTDKERLFILHYIGAAKRNGTEAALLAGLGNGSRDSARHAAHGMMRRPIVVDEIERLTAERNERLLYTADDCLRELLILKDECAVLSRKSAPALRTRLGVLKTIGDHVAVGAFRRQVGLSSPNGGPIQTVDIATLASLSDEELDQLERAREIIDRVTAGAPDTDAGADQGGEGAASQDA